jgi:hypothetical protein
MSMGLWGRETKFVLWARRRKRDVEEGQKRTALILRDKHSVHHNAEMGLDICMGLFFFFFFFFFFFSC